MCKTPGAKTRRGNEENWLFDIVSCGLCDARPHPEERACETVPPTRKRVRASRRMRTKSVGAPSCFETPRSVGESARVSKFACAAPLLSMRAGEGGAVPALPSLTRGSAETTIFDASEGSTCRCKK